MPKKKNITVYVPIDAKINIDSNPMEPPKVKYEERKRIIDRSIIRKLVEKKYVSND